MKMVDSVEEIPPDSLESSRIQGGRCINCWQDFDENKPICFTRIKRPDRVDLIWWHIHNTCKKREHRFKKVLH